jgi:hypothetical protein
VLCNTNHTAAGMLPSAAIFMLCTEQAGDERVPNTADSQASTTGFTMLLVLLQLTALAGTANACAHTIEQLQGDAGA